MAVAQYPQEPVAPPSRSDNYLTHGRGLLSWLLTLDHKRIGVMYLIAIFSSLLLGGLFALVIRGHLSHQFVKPDGTVGGLMLSKDLYNQMFTLHGAVMIFLFLIPSTPAALGNFVLPLMLGAKDVAFPRLNLLSFWFWVTGAVFFLAVLITGGLDTGWTFYTPYSTDHAPAWCWPSRGPSSWASAQSSRA